MCGQSSGETGTCGASGARVMNSAPALSLRPATLNPGAIPLRLGTNGPPPEDSMHRPRSHRVTLAPATGPCAPSAVAHARLSTDRWKGRASHRLYDSQMTGLRLRGDLAACPTNDKLTSLGSKLMCPNRLGGGKIDLDQGSLTARVRKIFASSWAGSARAQQESLDCISIEEEGLCAS
jgi:hypothetical protein